MRLDVATKKDTDVTALNKTKQNLVLKKKQKLKLLEPGQKGKEFISKTHETQQTTVRENVVTRPLSLDRGPHGDPATCSTPAMQTAPRTGGAGEGNAGMNEAQSGKRHVGSRKGPGTPMNRRQLGYETRASPTPGTETDLSTMSPGRDDAQHVAETEGGD